jgi:hypothetical protein
LAAASDTAAPVAAAGGTTFVFSAALTGEAAFFVSATVAGSVLETGFSFAAAGAF